MLFHYTHCMHSLYLYNVTERHECFQKVWPRRENENDFLNLDFKINTVEKIIVNSMKLIVS